ncbi:MAG: ArsR/SmtB family transcription factor [Candidatus Hodarchaeales archaeon]
MAQNTRVDEITDILPLINHPIRVDIIKLLYSEPQSFTDLLRHLSIESTSKLSFHLNKLEKLILKTENNEYQLNMLGEKTYDLILAFEEENLKKKSPKSPKNSTQLTLSINTSSLSASKSRVLNFTSNLIKNFNPSILIIVSALVLGIILTVIFSVVLNSYESSRNFDLGYMLVIYLIYYLPLVAFIIYAWHHKLPRRYSLVGGILTLLVGFFLSDPVTSYPAGEFEGIPYEGLSKFLWVGINIFQNEIPLNLVFILTLILFTLLFPLFSLIIIRVTKANDLSTTEHKDEYKLKFPLWVEILLKKEFIFTIGIIYLITALIYGQQKTGIEITYTWVDAAWGLTTRTIEIKHYLIPPIGYITPQFVLLIPVSLITYFILNLKALNPIFKKLLAILCVIFIPIVHLYDVLRFCQQTQKLEQFFALYSSVTPLELSITGVEQYLLMQLVHTVIDLVVIGITVSLLLKFFSWGRKFRKNDPNEIP